MMNIIFKNLASLLLIFIFYFNSAKADEIGSQNNTTAALSNTDVSNFLKSDFAKNFPDAVSLQANNDDSITRIKQEAISIHKSLRLSPADPSVNYDVLLQIGHFPRKRGITGGEGELVQEQQIAAYVANNIFSRLSKDFNVKLIAADNFGTNLKSKIFISFHTDSAPLNRKCFLGPSVGYDSVSDAKGMHALAFALAMSLDLNPSDFMADSYTKGLKNYYAFRRINTSAFEGVLEMAELTCPEQEKSLLGNADRLSKNLAHAIRWALRPAVK